MKIPKVLKSIFLVICFFVLFTAGKVFASTFYVDTNGVDSNDGSFGSPFRTIQKAADIVGAGDRVIVNAGIYNERVQIKSSGTISNPIVFEGELWSGGERLSIIDGSDVVTGWVTAPEIGQGVYKTTSIGYEPYAMVIEENGETYDIAKLYQGAPYGNNWDDYLDKDSNATEDIDGVTVNFWDGIEVLYSSDGTTTYIRFRNYDNPDQKIVRSSRQGAAVSIWGQSNVVVKNFKIRASHGGVDASPKGGSNPAPTSKITIENNKIINGARKISVVADDCIVRGNVMYMNGYAGYKTGHIPGPWLGTLNYESAVKKHLYQFYKYPVGYGTSPRDEEGIFLLRDGHKVYNNEIYETFQGIYVGSSNTEIYNNTIHDNSSIAFFFDGETGGVSNVSIYDNLIHSSNIAFRFGHFNKGNIQANIYRNKVWNPPGVGRSIFYHHNISGGTPTQFSRVYWYHNSFSGGSEFHSVSSYADDWGWDTFQNVRYINNIISSPIFVNESAVLKRSNLVELCEYNWIGGSGQAAWSGSTDISAPGQLLWSSATLHDFSLSNSAVIEAGIDLSQSFSLEGSTYSPLEGMQPGYFKGSSPDIGAVQSGLAGGSDTELPSLPTNLVANAVSEDQIDVSWTASSDNVGVSGYKIYRDGIQIASSQTVSYSDTGLTPSTTYSYTVSGYDTAENNSNQSNPVLATTNSSTSSQYGYTTLKTNASPIIDGNLSEYASANAIVFSPPTGGNTVTVKAVWDSEALYLGYEVIDAQLNASAATIDGSVWDDDSVEWFIDTQNNGGGSANPGSSYMLPDDYHGIVNIINTHYDSQGTISSSPTVSWNGNWASATQLNGTNNNDSGSDTSYTVEVKIPWLSIGYTTAPPDDTVTSMSFAINDKDASSLSYIMWSNISNAFENASKWQNVLLSGTYTVLPEDITPPAPPLDLIIGEHSVNDVLSSR